MNDATISDSGYNFVNDAFYIACSGTNQMTFTSASKTSYVFVLREPKTIKFTPLYNSAFTFEIYTESKNSMFTSGCTLAFENSNAVSDLYINEASQSSTTVSLDNVYRIKFSITRMCPSHRTLQIRLQLIQVKPTSILWLKMCMKLRL